jgi:hypothetical protein
MREKEFLKRISKMSEREFLKTYLLANGQINPNNIEELNERFFIALRDFELIISEVKAIAQNKRTAEINGGFSLQYGEENRKEF